MNLKEKITAISAIAILGSFFYGGLDNRVYKETRTLKDFAVVEGELALTFNGPEPNTYFSNSLNQNQLKKGSLWEVTIGIPNWTWIYSKEIIDVQKPKGIEGTI